MKQLLLILIILSGTGIARSQDSSQDFLEPKWTFNMELGLPVSVANKPFDDIMQGLIGVSAYGQYSFPFHLHVGLGARYELFNINEFSVPSPVDGNMHMAAGFLNIGWDQFLTDRFAVDFSVKTGYSLNYVITDLLKEAGESPREIPAFFLEPTLGLILTANEQNSYRWVLGWSMQGYGFSPNTIGLPSNEGYEQSELNKITQSLIVGFGYTYYFKSKKN